MKFSPTMIMPLAGATVLSTLALGGGPASAEGGYQLCISEYSEDGVNHKDLVLAEGDVTCGNLVDDDGRSFELWNHCAVIDGVDYAPVCENVVQEIARNAGVLAKYVVVRDEVEADQCLYDEQDWKLGLNVLDVCTRSTTH